VDQRIALEVFGAVYGTEFAQQVRPAHRHQPFVEQQLTMQPGPVAGADAHGGVNATGTEVRHQAAGLDAQMQARIARLEIRQTPRQPLQSKRRQHADVDRAATTRDARLFDGLLQSRQAVTNSRQQR
jgi:hypothetical protein